MEHFVIIQALCRAALSNPNNAIIQQIERLKKAVEKEGNKKEAKAFEDLLASKEKSIEMLPSKIKRSFLVAGEELTRNTPIPVDKETATPLAEIIFKDDLPTESPILNQEVSLAIDSVLNEWCNYDHLAVIYAQPSRSCLIFGSPGTGKTHLALWIAKQINMPVVVARLDGLMSSFLGTSSRNIGNLFSFASKYKCVLLLDEFDAIAKLRDDPHEVGEIKRVVNSLLQNLDIRNKSGFTIGITNHESLLDPAIWRRFEIQIHIPKPSKEVVPLLLRKYLVPIEMNETEISFLSWAINGSTGADIEAFAKWIKKSTVLDKETSLPNQAQKFAILNTGRISDERKKLLAFSEEELVNLLSKEDGYSFTQTDLSYLFKRSQSQISRILSKSK